MSTLQPEPDHDVGVMAGLFCSFAECHDSCCVLQEVTLLGLLGYLSYLCGDFMGFSGIVALFCCAVTISHYALHNVSSLSRVTTVSAFQTLSYVSEGAIFIYVGLDALDPIKWRVRLRLMWGVQSACLMLSSLLPGSVWHRACRSERAMWKSACNTGSCSVCACRTLWWQMCRGCSWCCCCSCAWAEPCLSSLCRTAITTGRMRSSPSKRSSSSGAISFGQLRRTALPCWSVVTLLLSCQASFRPA